MPFRPFATLPKRLLSRMKRRRRLLIRSYRDWLMNRKRKKYLFTQNWFMGNVNALWENALKVYIGKPNVQYLEVGVFEGRSLLWVAENILTHPSSRLIGVDLPNGRGNAVLRKNLELCKTGHRIEMRYGRSDRILREFPYHSMDIIYIDGAHDLKGALIDAVNAWYLLKNGGILIFDDYRLNQDRYPTDLRPQVAIDTFLLGFGSEIKILHQDYQVIIQKVSTTRSDVTTLFCDYSYEWDYNVLVHLTTHDIIPLTEHERLSLENILRDVDNGIQEIVLSSELFKDSGVKAVIEKLQLPFTVKDSHSLESMQRDAHI